MYYYVILMRRFSPRAKTLKVKQLILNLKIVLKVDGTGVTSRPGRETQETVWVDDEQIYVESKHDDDVDDEQIDLDKGSPPKITGFVWYCTKLVNPTTYPLKKRALVQKK